MEAFVLTRHYSVKVTIEDIYLGPKDKFPNLTFLWLKKITTIRKINMHT